MDRRRVRELVRAHARGATLNRVCLDGACLDGIRVNWESRDLVAALLWNAFRGDLDRERWASWIAFQPELSWERLAETMPRKTFRGVLSARVPYVREGDDLPEALWKHMKGAGA